MNVTEFFLFIFVPWAFVLLIGGFYFLYRLRYNIPVTVLRFMGNKGRPTIFPTKAKKLVIGGVPHLYIRGYKDPIRDPRSENYYPAVRGKWGALLLYELEDGWLTPVKPAWKEMSHDEKNEVQRACKVLNTSQIVEFEFDPETYKKLKLTIVDDVDADFFIDNLARQKTQYANAWERLQAFVMPATFLILGVLALVAWIMWVQEDPANAAQQCVQAFPDMCRAIIEKGGLTERLTDVARPGG